MSQTLSEVLNYAEGDAKSCTFQAMVLSGGDITTGKKKDGSEWRKRNYTIKDRNGDTTYLTCWNNAIDAVEVGKSYEFGKIVRSLYNEKTQLTVGQWSTLNVMDNPITPNANQTGQQQLNTNQNQQQQQQSTAQKQPRAIPADKLENINTQTEILYAINQAVCNKLKEYESNPNPAMIGQFCKIIYDKLEGNA